MSVMSTTTIHGHARASSRRDRRAAREQAIIDAARLLFDERGVRDPRVEDIARAAGLNKALIYRAFASKDEIFALAVKSYLDELRALTDALPAADRPEHLRQLLTVFADFCIAYPAFLDCGLALLRRPAPELREILSESVWFRISRAVARCVGSVQRALEPAADSGVDPAEDLGFLAGRLLTQMMGTMHLARAGVALSEPAPEAIRALALDPQQVRDACVRDALTVVHLSPKASS
jgi:AcrR family transcriptional regulator